MYHVAILHVETLDPEVARELDKQGEIPFMLIDSNPNKLKRKAQKITNLIGFRLGRKVDVSWAFATWNGPIEDLFELARSAGATLSYEYTNFDLA